MATAAHGGLLPEILESRARLDPGRRAYVFLNEDQEEAAVLTYGELHARALAVARHLVRSCAPGDRALLLFPQCLDFIVAYFGCLYAHVIAVPVNPPRRNRVQDATRGIIQDCEPSAVLTLSTMLQALRPSLDPVCAPANWLAVDELTARQESVEDFRPEPCAADSIAFLQYTSGSTSAPKGVMVSHGNLVANQEMIRRAFGHDEHSTVVGWAPFFHDQGLIGNVLQPLYVGASCVLMSPTAFVRWPLRWLTAISRYRAHTSGGPNFAYDACVARAARGDVPEIDLSCWKIAFNGAEPIRHETLRRFADTFAPFGFRETGLYPCYGLAEATLIVTGSQKGRGPRTLEADAASLGRGRYAPPTDGRRQTLAGSGTVLPGEDVRIVDPVTRRACGADEVGEIWVAGGHVAQGYWRHPAATAETFRAAWDGTSPGAASAGIASGGRPSPGGASLEGASPDEASDGTSENAYLRTGDLGVLIDGELYVVGRLKDVVIIRGRNYYPQDIEHTVQSAHPALQPGGCAAFSVPEDDGEKLVVVQEIRRDERRTADAIDVGASIRAAVAREHEIALGDLVLTLPGGLQKTSSGKIMRAAARKRYLEAGFDRWTSRTPSLAV